MGDEEQGQLSPFHGLRDSSPICHKGQGVILEEGISPLRRLPYNRPAFSRSALGVCWLTYPLLQPGSALLCCPGEVQGLLFWMLQQVRNRTSSPALMNPWPALLFVIDGRVQGKGISPLLIPPHSKQEAGLAFPHSHSWAGSPQPSHPGPTLLYCPGERQGQ